MDAEQMMLARQNAATNKACWEIRSARNIFRSPCACAVRSGRSGTARIGHDCGAEIRDVDARGKPVVVIEAAGTGAIGAALRHRLPRKFGAI
jgi:hypothetical protein